MKETADASSLTPHELTGELARANILSIDSLDANQAGHLSSPQMRVVLETFGFAILIPVCFLGMIVAGAWGFLSVQHGLSVPDDAGSLIGGAVLIVVAVLCLVGTGLLLNQTKRTGTDKYLTERRLPRLLLMPVDFFRGRAASVQGTVTPQVAETTTRSSDGSEDTKYYYAYRVSGMDFEVSEEGYRALPEWGAECRVYYLPLSKALLNIEVMDTAPLTVNAPESAGDDGRESAAPAVGAKAPAKAAALNRRAAHAQAEMKAADSIAGGLGTFGARLAFGNSKATEIQSRLSHLPSTAPFDPAASPVTAEALRIAVADSHVLAALGEPVQALAGVSGSTNRTNGTEVTDLVIPIAGARKHGTLFATARQNNGEWEFYRLEVKVDGSAEVIPLGG